MPVKPLNVFTYYDRQRFIQFSPQDAANWYIQGSETGKKKMAMYPCMGRKKIERNGINQLIFAGAPRAIFKSIDFMYVVVGSTVYQVSSTLSPVALQNADFNQDNGDVWFAYLPLIQGATVNAQIQAVYCMITDGIKCYIIDESANPPTMVTVTDPNTPPKPLYLAAFGNRFVVSSRNSTEFRLTQFNCYDTTTNGFNPATLFTVPGAGGSAVFAQESGIIRQMCVLHNQLYIFTDYSTGIWANIPSNVQTNFATTIFPWKKNTSYEWDYGINDPKSLDTDFGRMTFLGQNRNGLVSFMTSDGQMPTNISTQAINVLLQGSATNSLNAPFLEQDAVGFLYQYEDTVFYRVSSGAEQNADNELLNNSAASLEYNFDTQTWHRCIEVDGDRNLIRDHIYFQNMHIVTVINQRALYQMAGNIYTNDLINPDAITLQEPTAFITYPFRYELTTGIIAEDDYSEFTTDDIQVDFVWGEQTFIRYDGPTSSSVFIVSEESTTTDPVYLVAEDGVTFLVTEDSDNPVLNDETYNKLFKPHIELYISDDGGISFYSADVLEFSQLGVYSWRMRWYQGGTSRNRVYKLLCVSPSPIVILGATQNVRRVSGGAR